MQILIKVLIFYYFDLKFYIYIKNNILSYIINAILNQIILNNII